MHKADPYFAAKLSEDLSREARRIVLEAQSIRHKYPNLDGPELVRLVYWGASGTPQENAA